MQADIPKLSQKKKSQIKKKQKNNKKIKNKCHGPPKGLSQQADQLVFM